MDYMSEYKRWLDSDALSDDERAELREVEGNNEEIESRFFAPLSFGTAGLRGVLGIGLNRMNRFTVGQAAQGLAKLIVSNGQEPETVPPVEAKEEIITQTEEETVAVPKKEPKKETPKKEKPKKETPKKDVPKKEAVKPKEKTEAEKRAEAEKAAAEKKAAAERAAAEAAAKKIAGAFGKGTQMGNKGTGTTGSGLEGSPTGNSSEGKSGGVGGYGTFDLNGRSLGSGGLPMPVYNVQDEGRVVVTITVNPAGQVISTSINKRTNTVNASLRKAAEEAARKARFNQVDGVNNQTGTITYYFKLK